MKQRLDNKAGASFCVGPSHTIRWQWHVRDKVVPSPIKPECFIGLGGAPIWSHELFKKAEKNFKSADTLVVLVPDFRFGNGITLQEPKASIPPLHNGFLGVERLAMTLEHDQTMLQLGMAALGLWHDRFEHRARYLFWCLFGRQVHDRMAGNYIADGRYHHPTFNYDEIVAAQPDLDIIDLSPLLKMPMHEVRRLFIDTSSHPSQIGYLLLNGLIFDGLEARPAFDRAVAAVETDLIALAQTARAAAGRRILLTGRSIWLDVVMLLLGTSGAAKLAEAGLVLAPLDSGAGQPSISETLSRWPLSDCTPVILSAGGADLTSLLAKAFGNDSKFWTGQPVIDWEGATEGVIRGRGEVPKLTPLSPALFVAAGVIQLELLPHMVEQGPLGMPSWAGITYLLEQLPHLRLQADDCFKASAGYQIQGDVLVTEDNVAFLIGGNRSGLKFTTGEIIPTQASLVAFNDNIVGRLGHAQSAGVPYLHVIFPDKQSVLAKAFPIQPVCRLGDTYLAGLDPVLLPHVLYPADKLKSDTVCHYLPLDTHMTDHGSLEVLRLMLRSVGIKSDETLSHISSRITQHQRWAGDLGSKLTPKLYQEGTRLDPDWTLQKFQSPGGFNDGMVDIILNPDAPVNKTVLLFGDSFFRMMLDHLGAIFTQVICLRTRFVHSEMIDLIKPDIIFSGNAERYLSNVTPDTEAPAFALYPQLRNNPTTSLLAADKAFLDAWIAITAPNSTRATTFLISQGMPRRTLAPLPLPAPLSYPQSANQSRSRASYDRAPFLSIKHTTYFSVYDTLFSPFIGRAPTIVEIGVLGGGSLFMWRDFFGQDARIIGVDLNPDAIWLRDHGFEIHIGSQSDPSFWEDFFRNVGDVDIILDDGGHTFTQQIITASTVLDHIKNGGLLVVEDTHSSYMAEFGGPSRLSFISWAKNLVDGVNHRFSGLSEKHDSDHQVWSVQFFESIVAIFVDRQLTTVTSLPTKNKGVLTGARDFREYDEHLHSDMDIRKHFKY